MEKLHPGAKWLFRLRGYSSFIIIIIFLSVASSSIIRNLSNRGGAILGIVLGILFGAIILTIIFAEIYARMAYNRWLYEFGPASLKLERGIIWKKYSNIPYERVQNVDVHRGVLARMLRFSTVDIQTAGFHASYNRRGMPKSEGHIPAVSIEAAEKIREFLMKKITGKKTSSQGM